VSPAWSTTWRWVQPIAQTVRQRRWRRARIELWAEDECNVTPDVGFRHRGLECRTSQFPPIVQGGFRRPEYGLPGGNTRARRAGLARNGLVQAASAASQLPAATRLECTPAIVASQRETRSPLSALLFGTGGPRVAPQTSHEPIVLSVALTWRLNGWRESCQWWSRPVPARRRPDRCAR
jgi:hypothetical protein